VLAAIEKAGIAENTVVVFVSDNGGLDGAANMGPLRGAKSGTFEGGIRVPLIIRWPGHIKPGTLSHQVSATFDLTASILQLAMAKIPKSKLDGFDIINHVAEQRNDLTRKLFWRGKRGDRTWWAVRDGDWKYVRKTEEGQTEEWLFDIADDVGEQRNLLAKQASTSVRLKKLLVEWETDVKATR